MTQSDSDTIGLRLGDCQTLPPLDDFIDAVIERYDSDGAIRVDSGNRKSPISLTP